MIENGLIFEINRRVLHPLGLALIVDIERGKRKQLSITSLVESEDEAGFLYDNEAFELGSENFKEFVQKRSDRLSARKESVGFIIQEETINKS